VERVIGIDNALAMLEVARENLRAHGASNVELVLGEATLLPLEEGMVPYEKALRKRRVWVEPLFEEAKEWHGMRRFRLRTLRRVNAEAVLIATGQDIKRLLTFSGRGPRKLAQAQALQPPTPTPSPNSRLLQGSHRRRSTPLLARFSTG
jgi:hypothetical protein